MGKMSLGDVVAIDEVEYLVTAKTVEEIAKAAELIPLQRLFDKKVFMVTREKFEKCRKIDHLK